MPRPILPLALVSLTAACDPMTAPGSDPESVLAPELDGAPRVQFRRSEDGECADFSTISLNTTYRGEGYPPPYPYHELEMGVETPFHEMPEDWRAAYEHDLADRSANVLEAVFVSLESTPEQCTSACAEMDLEWNGGACVIDLQVGHSEPELADIGYRESPILRTNVETAGQLSCSCG